MIAVPLNLKGGCAMEPSLMTSAEHAGEDNARRMSRGWRATLAAEPAGSCASDGATAAGCGVAAARAGTPSPPLPGAWAGSGRSLHALRTTGGGRGGAHEAALTSTDAWLDTHRYDSSRSQSVRPTEFLQPMILTAPTCQHEQTLIEGGGRITAPRNETSLLIPRLGSTAFLKNACGTVFGAACRQRRIAWNQDRRMVSHAKDFPASPCGDNPRHRYGCAKLA